MKNKIIYFFEINFEPSIYDLGKTPSSSTLTSVATSSSTQNQTSKPTQITAKSEVSQSTAISDRPKAKPNSRKKLQQQKQQQLLQQQLQQASSENAVSISRKRKEVKNNLNKIDDSQASQTPPPSASTTNTTNSSAILSDSKSSSNNNVTNPSQTKSEDCNEKVDATEQEVPQTVPEASSTSDDQKDQKAPENCSGARSCSLIDLETFQKMRLNNLSNRSAYWDPKVFRKIAQIIDPPKSPTETPPESSQSSRPHSPDVKSLASELNTSSSLLLFVKSLLFFSNH
jgi:hypothetical protein